MKDILLSIALISGSCQAARRPEIAFVGFDHRRGSYAVFELVNDTGSDFSYWEQFGPFFSVDDLGDPSPIMRFRCFNGVGRDLLPGCRVRVNCPIGGCIGPIQIRMTVWDARGQATEVVGPELDISTGKANRPVRRDRPSAGA